MGEKAMRLRVIVAVLFATVAGCATSPLLPDGPWSTGHEILGGGEIGMELNLTWSSVTVEGTGGYSAVAGTNCGSTTFSGSGPLKLFAERASAHEISGYLQFGSDARIPYRATLANNRIDGVLVSTDGTQCPLTLFSGLIP